MGHTLTWEKGRQLKSFDGNSYTYNANGIRTSKTVNGVKHTYTLDGTKILREAWGNERIIPLYDNEDSICGLIYGKKSSPEDAGYVGESFFFLKNLQGHVVAILNNSGVAVVRYTYDAWGRHLSISGSMAPNLGQLNPFRYRGYIYDSETQLYYLQSRYYDSTIGRFINADNYPSTGQGFLGNNMFAYCLNNPLLYSDETGESATVAGAICGAFFGALNAVISGGSIDEVIQCALVGMATGAAAGFVADLSVATCGIGTAVLLSAAAGGIMSASNSAASQYILTGEVDDKKVVYDGVIGAIAGGTSTAMGDLVKPVAKGLSDGIKHVNTLISTEIMMVTAGKSTASFLFDIGCSAVTGLGAWAFGTAFDHYNYQGWL